MGGVFAPPNLLKRGRISTAAGSGNSQRPLTHQLDLRERGLAVKATPTTVHSARSLRWMGRPSDYQAEAAHLFRLYRGRLAAWSWITTECEMPMCLATDCMVAHSPVHIDYPVGICVYCGDPAGTRDHLIPEPWSGATERRQVAVVPACADCNNRINDLFEVSVHERRKIAHRSIAKKYRDLLNGPVWVDEDLAEMGNTLRQHIVKSEHKREWVKGRLAWPVDPHYDLRAFQRSGIEDPSALGLV